MHAGMRMIHNYRDLFDDNYLDILVLDVLVEHYEILSRCERQEESEVAASLLGAIEYFSTKEELEAFKEEFGLNES